MRVGRGRSHLPEALRRRCMREGIIDIVCDQERWALRPSAEALGPIFRH